MSNMFSGNVVKKIPKDLKDCYRTDSITQNLWSWCERLEKWGCVLCVILVVIGIIAIISNAVETAQLLDEYDIDTYEIRELMAEEGIEVKSVFEVVIEDIIKWSLYCFLEYCAYHILALLIGSLATIVQHTKISANIALYNSAKTEGITDDYDITETESVDNTENAEKKCNNITHEIYISEIRDIDTNSENAHWVENKITGGKQLICNHCGKELVFIGTFDEEKNYKEVICPKCNRKLEFRATERFGKCPFCEIGFEIE